MQPSPRFTGEWKLFHGIINIPNDAQSTRINTLFWYDNCKNRLPKLWHQHKITNPVHGRFIQHLRGQPFTARHGRLYNERRWYVSYEQVKRCGLCLWFFRWSWPGRTRGCGNRHRIWCSRPTAWQELGRWRGQFSSPLYPSRTPPAYPQGSLFPHRASCLQAAGVCSLWKQNSGMIKMIYSINWKT